MLTSCCGAVVVAEVEAQQARFASACAMPGLVEHIDACDGGLQAGAQLERREPA